MKQFIATAVCCIFILTTFAQTTKPDSSIRSTKWTKSLKIASMTQASLRVSDIKSGAQYSGVISLIFALSKGKSGIVCNINSGNGTTVFYTYALSNNNTVYVVGAKSLKNSNGYGGVGFMKNVKPCLAFVEFGSMWHNPSLQLSTGVLLPLTILSF